MIGNSLTLPASVQGARTAPLDAYRRRVVVEALAAALVEDYGQNPRSSDDSPAGFARQDGVA